MNEAVADRTFQDLSRGVAERFLQTVVVLDDGAFMKPAAGPFDVREPDHAMPILDDAHDRDSSKSDATVDRPNPLDAGALITNFASLGLICSVLSPSPDGDESTAALRASGRADIVILDWQLGDEGLLATDIIRCIVEEDARQGGRLRIIVVYTAEPDREAVRSTVAEALNGFGDIARPGNILALEALPTRILFIGKGSTSDYTGQIEETELPARLVDEFADISTGILSNVALGGIAAVREHTHHVLARFHPGMDGPFLTHRLLLVTPEDAEEYAVDLLASEFLSILQGRMIGTRYAGRDAVLLHLSALRDQGVTFRLMTKKDSAEDSRTLSVEQLMKLVDAGPPGLAEIPDIRAGKAQQDKLHERLYLMVADDLRSSISAHHEFARTSAHARERHRVAPDYRAKLTLGTIVRSEDEYLICIQPVCDAVRLQNPTAFVFSPLVVDTNRFDVVVSDPVGTTVCLKLNARVSAVRTIDFGPDADTRTVVSVPDSDGQAFVGVLGRKLTWICDLKTSFALRLSHRVAENLSRIGLDEFEWQRRHAPGA